MPANLFTLRAHAVIDAPVERCFLLSTHIDTVRQTLAMTPVAGRTSGHVVLGDRVTWRGCKFFLPQVHHTLITGYRLPSFFQDTQERGRFSFFQHDHHLRETATGGTLLEDEVRFALPFGPIGRMVGRAVLIPHIQTLLRRRFALLKRLAETDAWREILAHDQSPALEPESSPGTPLAGPGINSQRGEHLLQRTAPSRPDQLRMGARAGAECHGKHDPNGSV